MILGASRGTLLETCIRTHPEEPSLATWQHDVSDIGMLGSPQLLGGWASSAWLLHKSPKEVGLWDHFQMAFFGLVNGRDPNHLQYNWDDPPSRMWEMK